MAIDVITELKELRESINFSSEHAKRQLENIEKMSISTLFSIIISLVSLLGFSIWHYTLSEIIYYWIPASYLLITLWLLYGFIKLIKHKNPKEKKKDSDSITELIIKVSYLGFKALSIIFAPCIIISLSHVYGATSLNISNTSAVIIAIFSFIFIIPMFISEKIMLKYFLMSKNDIDNFDKLKKNIDGISTHGKIKIVLISIICIILCFFLIIVTPYLILKMNLQYSFLVIVSAIQFILFLVTTHLISYSRAINYFKNLITEYARINDRISKLLASPEKEITYEDLKKEKESYFNAKPYELFVHNMFKFLNIYYLIPSDIVDEKELD